MRAPLLFAIGLAALTAACSGPPPMKTYAYPAWGFSVDFRATPQVIDHPGVGDPSKDAHSMMAETNIAGRDDFVNVIDGTGSPKSDDQALEDAPGRLATILKGTLGPMTYAATGKVVGREFLLKLPGKPTAKVRIFVASRHLYEIISQSVLGPDDPEVTEFLDSFRLLPAPPAKPA